MNILFLAWAGYDFREDTETVDSAPVGICQPNITSEDIGEKRLKAESVIKKINLTGDELKPNLIASPRPTT